MFFDWAADLTSQKMTGSVIHDMTVITSSVDMIYLDVSGWGMVQQVAWMPPGSAMNATNNEGNIPANVGSFNLTSLTFIAQGSSYLKVFLDRNYSLGEELSIQIFYWTRQAPGSIDDAHQSLFWMTASETAGGVYPAMFSYCEPNACRSLAPMQDTPAFRITYAACV
jgi:hypothetical protein